MDRESKKYTVVVSDRAVELLVSHIQFVAQVSEQAAEQLRTTIMKAIATLENYPGRHPWLSDPMLPAHKYCKMPIERRYLIIYQIKSDVVYVEFVVDCRQEYQWLI